MYVALILSSEVLSSDEGPSLSAFAMEDFATSIVGYGVLCDSGSMAIAAYRH